MANGKCHYHGGKRTGGPKGDQNATTHGIYERYYTEEVEAQEVGRATVASGATEEHVEMLTFRAEPSGHGGATLLLEWERTRIAIPVSGL